MATNKKTMTVWDKDGALRARVEEFCAALAVPVTRSRALSVLVLAGLEAIAPQPKGSRKGARR